MTTPATTFELDGVDSTTIPEILVTRVRRPLTGKPRDEYVEIPGREGAWLFPEKKGMRTITIEADLLAGSLEERRAAVVAFADLLDAPEDMARLIVDDEPDRFHMAKLANAPDPDEWLQHGNIVVDLEAEPYSYALEPSEESWSATSGVAHPFTIPDTVYAIPEVEITATGGALATLTLALNGLSLVATFDPAIGSGDTITVSTLAYVVTDGTSGDPELDGTFDPDELNMSGVSGDFGFIVPGANTATLTFTGGASSLAVTIRWRARSR